MPKVEVKLVSASWCQPCKQMKPVLEQVCKDSGTDLTLYDVDTVEGSEFASKHGVRGVPTMLVMEGDTVKDVLVGMKSKSEIEKAIL